MRVKTSRKWIIGFGFAALMATWGLSGQVNRQVLRSDGENAVRRSSQGGVPLRAIGNVAPEAVVDPNTTSPAGSVNSSSAPGQGFTEHDKAYYAESDLVAFVRPGLVFKIVSASVAADGTVSARYTVTDPKGLPLDRLGIYTPGTVGSSWILTYIPAGKTQYTSYTTRTQVSPITGVSAVQAGTDSGGAYTKNADGDYTYTFKTKLPSGYDKTATHTIGLYGSRNLTEFDLGINAFDTTFSWVPDGSPVTVTRDVIKQVTCNKCHQDLSAHGTGGRKSMEVCILCHQPQTIDPDTGHSMDMAVMTHKIHAGEELPSVQAGTPYVIIGNSQSRHDYSKVVFPADAQNCTFCHEQNTGAAQKMAYLKPTMAACGSCHDNVDFANAVNHPTAETNSNNCSTCHLPEGELEFDASVIGAHTRPAFSKELPGTVVEFKSITNGGPGQKPTVTFTIQDKSGNPIPFSQMARVRFVVAGPNTDYPAYTREDVASPQSNADGSWSYTFKASPVPADSKGSFTMGVEAYRNVTIAAGTDKQQVVRDFCVNKTMAFSVDGSAVTPRRTVVSTANCNKCHSFLSLHGGNRNTVEECVLCHNPNTLAESPNGDQTVDFRVMIHKIHTGEELTSDYTVGDTNFNEVLYPGFRQRCNACHVNNSQRLPLQSGLLDVQDPQGYLNPAGPVTAACTSCHTSIEAASHALINTSRLGESCTVCHGSSADFSVDRVHAQ